MSGGSDDDGIVLTEEQKRRRRARSIAIAISLGALVVLFFVRDAGEGTGCASPSSVEGDDQDRPPV